ncbi:DsbA family protein [Agarilytica rhodophyticola]|uniref:DsbA family protein n=1 Tax=Agarilytica rhodophyticola TaxID=1737490 RepID=UPI000B341918|nr:DsbA family protein [Agarilytica rhodophyticola]
MKNTKFIIIYDKYCGWCYGAAPNFDVLVNTGAKVEILHLHLFQGTNAPRVKEGKGDYIVKTDARISQLTEQTFSEAYTDNVVRSKTEILDSTYSALGAAVVHGMGAKKEFSLRQRLEKQRFIDGTSDQNRNAVIQALIDEGVEPEAAEQFDSQKNIEKAHALSKKAIALMAQVGLHGVPTILKIEGGNIEAMDHSKFYGKLELIPSLIAENNGTVSFTS